MINSLLSNLNRSGRRASLALAAFGVLAFADSAQAQNLAEEGKKYFAEAQCNTCHSVTSKREPSHIGPALYGATKKPGRSKEWMIAWISDPEGMMAKKDKVWMEMDKEYPNAMMTGMLKALNKNPDGSPNLALINKKATAIYEYLKANDAAPEGGASGGAKKKKN